MQKNMNLTRNGKIARLPKGIREELNQRLEQGGNGGESQSCKVAEWERATPAGVAAPQNRHRPDRSQQLRDAPLDFGAFSAP